MNEICPDVFPKRQKSNVKNTVRVNAETSELIQKLAEVSLHSKSTKCGSVSLISTTISTTEIKKTKSTFIADSRKVQESTSTTKSGISRDKDYNAKVKPARPKKTKKKDSFIVSDSSGSDDNSIMYHRILSEQIKTDVAKTTPRRSSKKKTDFSDDGIFTPFLNENKWRNFDCHSSNKENVNTNVNQRLQSRNDGSRKTNACSSLFKKDKSNYREPDSCKIIEKSSSSPTSFDLKLGSKGKKELSWCFSDVDSSVESSSENEKLISPSENKSSSSNDYKGIELISPISRNSLTDNDKKSISSSDRNETFSDDEVFLIAKPATPEIKKRTITKKVPRKNSSSDGEIKKETVAGKTTTPITFRLNNVKKLTPLKTSPESDNSEGPSLFLRSLSTFPGSRVHADAQPYKKKFKKMKEELASYLFRLFNEEVFGNRLPSDMKIEWNARMRTSSGFCYNKRIKTILGPDKECLRSSRIVLSTKIIETPERLRDTLIHEMCHAAAWLVDKTADGHGPFWKSWASKANRRFPDLPPIKRCHDYAIKTKFKYKCVKCGYTIGRHSKSLNLERKRCGYCYGQFELIVDNARNKGENANTSPKNVKAKPLSKFALFVKENYGKIKAENSSLKHGDIMRTLSTKFAETKKVESI